MSERICAVCKKPCGSMSLVLGVGVHVCMSCDPLRRCGALLGQMVCLGIMEHTGTPNDQGLRECNLCGRTDRR